MLAGPRRALPMSGVGESKFARRAKKDGGVVRVASQFSPAREWEPLALFGTRPRYPMCILRALSRPCGPQCLSAWSTKTGRLHPLEEAELRLRLQTSDLPSHVPRPLDGDQVSSSNCAPAGLPRCIHTTAVHIHECRRCVSWRNQAVTLRSLSEAAALSCASREQSWGRASKMSLKRAHQHARDERAACYRPRSWSFSSLPSRLALGPVCQLVPLRKLG